MNRIYPLSFILFFSGACLPAQAQSIALGNASVCAGQDVLLPVAANGLYNIGAITLYIRYDSAHLIYASLQNIDPQLEDILVSRILTPSQLVVTWSGITGANFPENKLFDIQYQYISEDNDLIFGTGCEIADVNTQILNITFNNGSVGDGQPIVEVQPQDIAVEAGEPAVFHIVSPNATLFQWYGSSDNGATWIGLQEGAPYSNTHGDSLLISSVSGYLNNNLYRCVLGPVSCSSTSDAAKLTVNPMSVEKGSGNEVIHQFISCPNPFYETTKLAYRLTDNGNVAITVLNRFGNTISELARAYQNSGEHSVSFDAKEIAAGCYFVRLELKNTSGQTFQAIRKIIKTH